MRLLNVQGLQEEITKAIHAAEWRRDYKINEVANDEGVDARCYIGEVSGWRLMVVGWKFPDRDGRGADGTALHTSRGLVIRFTKEQAAEANRVAEEATCNVDQR
jgi:hypothetical protein